eukprot:CAMPEP_0197633702 /NCGR_PEP_ID=MMETSP1338-20131121/10008_1 /TAXON_ID=43686 ORGANISM="Pelagodinium beii, Strain RCC1491" /NCGR_SAMPLE_ID=MMETSP1338 /ASSEMBLY_ACC=CAM_ASM_000754 /LENGTH=151 /DNA_ID=CAMNT_0043205423 /DNA_START=74 /DNA_END=526 /DNA_ORIENTATION=+
MTLTGVMHPSSSSRSSTCASVEDFLREYEMESQKRGQPLIKCYDAVPQNDPAPTQWARSWSEELDCGAQQRTFTEEIEQVRNYSDKLRDVTVKQELQRQLGLTSGGCGQITSDGSLQTLDKTRDPVDQLSTRPQVLAVSLSLFSIGLFLGW